MFSKSFVAALLAAVPAFAHVTHEMLDSVPTGWEKIAEPSADQTVHLEVALNLNNIDKMVQMLYAVSTPGNPSYGKHWDRDQVNTLVQPSDEAVEATVGWLNDANITSSVVGASVHMFATVSQAESLLNTKFSYYQNQAGVSKLRTTGYAVHESVSSHIDFIHPTTFFGNTVPAAKVDRLSATATTEDINLSKRQTQSGVDAACTTGLTPACVRQLYNIPANYTPYGNAGASIGFGSFLNESAQESDLLLFENRYGFKNQTFAVELINGGVNDQNATTASDGEANLDAQNIVGVAHGIPLTEYITGGSPPFLVDVNNPTDTNEPYLQYYQYLLKKTNQQLPQVISNSYGDDEETVPRNYAVRVCNLIGMMGLRGVTVIESSGDTGVGATCRANTGKKLPRFTPVFPATCPYILSVGGTQNIPEIAWVGSSGGFSDYFPRPSYQETAVNTYLDDHVSTSTALYYSNYANFSGRGFPDVSAMSVSPYYYGYYGGKLQRNGGTSAAAPVIAGIIGLINDARLHAGKSSLGFFNPALYSQGYTTFRDIVAGRAIGCDGSDTQTGSGVAGAGIIPYAFWNATVGWDPATGFGVPNFSELLTYALSI